MSAAEEERTGSAPVAGVLSYGIQMHHEEKETSGDAWVKEGGRVG